MFTELLIAAVLTDQRPTAVVSYCKPSGPVFQTEERFAGSVQNIITDAIYIKASHELQDLFVRRDQPDVYQIRKHVSIDTIGKSILLIRAKGVSDAEGVRLVNAIAEAFRLRVNVESSQEVEKQLKKNIAEAQDQVLSIDKEITEIRREADSLKALLKPNSPSLSRRLKDLEDRIPPLIILRERARENTVRSEVAMDRYYRTKDDSPRVRVLHWATVPGTKPRPIP